jgi:[ribosomal protein S5]-alanine N-acetyltransferase
VLIASIANLARAHLGRRFSMAGFARFPFGGAVVHTPLSRCDIAERGATREGSHSEKEERKTLAIQFETERLIVREWDPGSDAEQAFRIYGDPLVTRYLGAKPWVEESVETQRAMLQRIVDKYGARCDQTGAWPTVLRETGEVIGALIFKELPDAEDRGTGDYEIGWQFRRDMWGQGIATEGARALLAHVWQIRPDLTEIIALAYPENVASLRVMQKIGMEPLGITTKYYGLRAEHYHVLRP